MKLREVKPIAPLTLAPHDKLTVTYREPNGHVTVLMEETEIDVSMIVDHIAIIDIEQGDIPGYTEGLGSVLLATEEEDE